MEILRSNDKTDTEGVMMEEELKVFLVSSKLDLMKVSGMLRILVKHSLLIEAVAAAFQPQPPPSSSPLYFLYSPHPPAVVQEATN